MEKQKLLQPAADSLPVVEGEVLSRSWRNRVNLKLALILVVLIVILLSWVVIASPFSHFKLANQQISVSSSNVQLGAELNRDVSSYRLSLAYPNGATKAYNLAQAGLSLNTTATIAALRHAQDKLTNRLEWWQPITISLMFRINQAVLNQFIATNADVVVQPAQNADLSLSGGGVQLANSVDGKEYGLANASLVINQRAASLNPAELKLKQLTLKPVLTAAELASSETSLKQTLDQHIVINLANQSVVPSATTVASWLSLAPDTQTKSVSVSVDSSKVQAYLASLASNYSTPEKDQIDVTNADGSISVLEPGVEGLSVSSSPAAVSTIASNLLSAKGLSVNLPAAAMPFGTVTAGDWPKWIEVNLTTKRLYVYQNSQLINTFLVTAGKPLTPTPTGTFYIWQKLSLQTMIGPGYVQPNVPWINYFDHSGDAIHGNYWRPTSYFGNVNSSHGCVGLMVSDALWVYDWAPVGTPVVIHT